MSQGLNIGKWSTGKHCDGVAVVKKHENHYVSRRWHPSFKVHYFSKPYFDHVLHPSKDIYKREEERALYGPLAKNERHDMSDLLVSFQV